MLRPEDVIEQIRRVVTAGGIVDLGNDQDARWEVAGEFLVEVLQAGDLHPRGLRVANARVIGPFNWDRRRVDVRLAFSHCVFDADVDLEEARLLALSFRGCSLPAFWGRRLTTLHDVDLTGSQIAGGVQLYGADIGGNLILDNAQLTGARELALNAINIRIAGDAHLRRTHTSEGEVSFLGCTIDGGLDCDDAHLRNEGGIALNVVNGHVRGDVRLGYGFIAHGEVQLQGMATSGGLECDQGTFENPGGIALNARNAQVGEDVLLGKGFIAEGSVNLRSLRAGTLDCSSGTFRNVGGTTIDAYGATLSGAALLAHGFRSEGEVNLRAVKIGQALNCDAGAFDNPGGQAIVASLATIGGAATFRDGFTACGEVSLFASSIGSYLECRAGSFLNAGSWAISAARITVAASALFHHDFTAEGCVWLRGARIGGDLDFSGSRIDGGSGVALACEQMQVAGALRFQKPAAPVRGIVDLTGAAVAELDDSEASWPITGSNRLHGLTYTRFGPQAPRDPARRLAWIRRQATYESQPYQQFASVLRASGEVTHARYVSIAAQDDLRRSGDLSSGARAWNWFLGRATGHGYRPERSLWLMAALYLITLLAVSVGARSDAFEQVGNTPVASVTASRCRTGYPCLSPPALALENITPILNLHQADNWQVNAATAAGAALRDWLYLSTILGWVGTTLVITAFSGFTRSD